MVKILQILYFLGVFVNVCDREWRKKTENDWEWPKI